MNAISTEKFNTNNGWGFGGSIGTSTKYDNGITLIAARNHHRHTPPSCGNCVYVAVEDGTEPFKVQLRRGKEGATTVKNLKDVEVISVLRYEDSYLALVGDFETFTKYGWTYTRIKKITLTK